MSESVISASRAVGFTSPQYSRMQRNNAPRVVQNARFSNLNFCCEDSRFCGTHCNGSSTTLQLALSWATKRFEGRAGRGMSRWDP